MDKPIKFVAELAHVREVSLRGAADLAYWKDRLKEEDLAPAEKDGQAQILITAAEGRFRGIRFRELSFTVLVGRQGERVYQDAGYLIHAFNSCRFFAFCERVFFSTPYYHADVCVSVALPASMGVVIKGKDVFRAEMRADAPASPRQPSRSGEDDWDGPIFLPTRGGRKDRAKLFVASIKGHTRTYPFVESMDSVAITPSQDGSPLQALIDSRFVGKEWAIREDATHAKSKTYKRTEYPKN